MSSFAAVSGGLGAAVGIGANLPPFLSIRELAGWLGVSRDVVRRMIEQGDIRATKLGASRSAAVRISRDLMLRDLGLVEEGATPRRRRRAADPAHHRLAALFGLGADDAAHPQTQPHDAAEPGGPSATIPLVAAPPAPVRDGEN